MMQTRPIPRRRLWGWVLLSACLATSLPTQAQDTVPETPPEMRDFRLDDPPARKSDDPPPAKPEPTVPQPAAPSPGPAVKAAERAPAKQQISASPTRAQPAPATPVAAPETPAVADTEPAGTGQVPSRPANPEPAELATDAQPIDWLRFWPVLAIMLSIAAAFGIFRLWSRTSQPAADQDAGTGFSAQPDTARTDALPPAAAPREAASIAVRFQPQEARLSLANLTLSGKLHLHYTGMAPLPALKLRSRLMSACDGQAPLIRAFHSDPSAGEVENLGAVVPGEEISLTLEMQIPRAALHAFDWRERRFIAPIVLINIAADNADIALCRFSCVIGQPGDPASPRLNPIPIDRGPKSFEALQFRTIDN